MNYKKNELNKMKDIKKIRTVLLDDAPFINDSFEILLGYSFPFIEVVGKAESVKDGIKVIKETSPDLVFLDIKFKDGIGFDIIKNTSGLDYRVIVISGHPNFGPEALTFSVLHYLNKPPELEIIKEAIKRFVDDREDRELKEEIRLFKENKSVTNDRILFRTKSGEKFYNYCDIVRFEANGSYTDIYFNLDKKVTVCESLKEISLKLNSNHFIRIHKSHITNVHYILDSDFGSLPNIILKNKKLLPIGKSFKDLLRKHILQN